MLGYDRVIQESWHKSQAGLPPVRCAVCNRLLFRGAVEKIEIKCPKCGTVQILQRNGDDWISGDGPLQLRGKKPGNRERRVTDSAGRLVAIPERPRRVIILNSSNLGLFVAAGGKPVGRGTADTPDFLPDEFKHIPTVGEPADPDLKHILALRPDLVIGMAMPAHQALATVLERKGIPVLLQTFARYPEVLGALRFYGELSGNPAPAAKKIARIERHRRELVEQSVGRPAPRALIVWTAANDLYTALPTSFIGDLVKRLGGVNVSDLLAPVDEKLAYAPLDLEAVARIQPDVVLVINHHAGMLGSAVASGMNRAPSPQWQELNAVRQKRVYQLPRPLFAVNPGAQIETALTVLAELLYGEPSIAFLQESDILRT